MSDLTSRIYEAAPLKKPSIAYYHFDHLIAIK